MNKAIRITTAASLMLVVGASANAEMILTENQMDRVTAGAFETAFAQNMFSRASSFAEGMTAGAFASVGTNFAQAWSFAQTVAAGSASASSSSSSFTSGFK